MPIGPINLTVLTKGMRDGFKPAFWTGVGSATMEFFYCLLAMFGMGALVRYSLGNIIVQVFAFTILVLFGFRNLVVHPKRIYNGEFAFNNGGNGRLSFLRKHHIHNTFLVGAVLYALNPTFIIFWVTVAGFIKSIGLITSLIDNFMFSLGVGIGVVLWFYLLLKFVNNIVEFKTKTIACFHRISGVIILLFALYLGLEILKSLV